MYMSSYCRRCAHKRHIIVIVINSMNISPMEGNMQIDCEWLLPPTIYLKFRKKMFHDAMTLKSFLHHWHFVRGISLSLVVSLTKAQVCRIFMFLLLACACCGKQSNCQWSNMPWQPCHVSDIWDHDCSEMEYCKTSNISCTLIENKIVDHSDVVGASPVGATSTTSSFST